MGSSWVNPSHVKKMPFCPWNNMRGMYIIQLPTIWIYLVNPHPLLVNFSFVDAFIPIAPHHRGPHWFSLQCPFTIISCYSAQIPMQFFNPTLPIIHLPTKNCPAPVHPGHRPPPASPAGSAPPSVERRSLSPTLAGRWAAGCARGCGAPDTSTCAARAVTLRHRWCLDLEKWEICGDQFNEDAVLMSCSCFEGIKLVESQSPWNLVMAMIDHHLLQLELGNPRGHAMEVWFAGKIKEFLGDSPACHLWFRGSRWSYSLNVESYQVLKDLQLRCRATFFWLELNMDNNWVQKVTKHKDW